MASEVGQSPLHSHEVSFALLHGAGKGSRTPVNRLETCGNAVIPYPLLHVPPRVRPSPQDLGLRRIAVCNPGSAGDKQGRIEPTL